jgi:lipoprotein NlpD
VVYAGNGLKGYGNLVIVEHDPSTLSAYAYNQSILVEEKQTVTKGQVIATLGTKDELNLLHFEIRIDGSPVDPQNYLP